jgi:hypothetical protein
MFVVPTPCLVRVPRAGDDPRVQDAIRLECVRVEQIRRPVLQRTTEPLPDRDPEPSFRSFKKRSGNVASQYLPQDPLLRTTLDLPAQGKPPSKLHDGVVEQRNSRFE